MNAAEPSLSKHPITVLLVDDQAIVAEAIRRMLAGDPEIHFHYCADPAQAIATANEIQPTVILQDLVMPDIDGLTLVRFFRVNPKTKEVPMIVLSAKEEAETKAQAFAVGANDYLVKLPDKLELIARVRYHSKGYIASLERNEAYRKLAEREKLLAEEVATASRYVMSLLPERIPSGSIRVDWRFVPSTTLGGDSFGYHRLDEDHFAVYLLDVSGHGVGSSLLSVSAMNVLRAQSLPNTDFRRPAQVLAGLNNAFLMENHGEKYFTIWYGVFQSATRELCWAGGGHPSALLIQGENPTATSIRELASQGPMIGLAADMPFDEEKIILPSYAWLYIFSDGCFEIERPNAPMWTFDEMRDFLMTLKPEANPMDRLLAHARALHRGDVLNDDFSMIQVGF